MFGIFNSSEKKIQKATQFVVERMVTTVGHLQTGPLANEHFNNLINSPYHSGYIQGKISAILAYLVHSGKLPNENANMVSGMALMQLFDKDISSKISTAIKTHSAQNSKKYQIGYERGSKVGLYMVGGRDIRKDPEYKKAIQMARNVESELNRLFPKEAADSINDPDLNALTGLEMIWFTESLAETTG